MPEADSGPAFCNTRKSSGVASRSGSLMRADRSSSEVKTTARPSFSNSLGSAAERLKIAPPGASEPNSATRPPTGCNGSARGGTPSPSPRREMGPGRRQIDEDRGRIADLVEALQIDVDAGAAGDRSQVQDRVGRTADRHQDAQRVLDCV